MMKQQSALDNPTTMTGLYMFFSEFVLTERKVYFYPQ